MTVELRKILWAGNVRAHPIPARLEAAAQFGYAAVALSPDDVQTALANGQTYKDLRKAAADTGVAMEHLDPIATWAPSWRPADDGWQAHDMITDFLALGVEDFFAMAEQLEARSLTALGSFEEGTIAVDRLTDAFGQLCDRAARQDMRVDLEFIPFWGIPDLDLAWRIVEGAGCDNGTIGFDFWHFSRGNPDRDLLNRIPGNRIGWVQVSDASLTPQVDSIVEDCLFYRVQPGQGEFDVTGLLCTLDGQDALRLAGPEIFSAEIDNLDVTAAVAAVDAGFEAALRTAGVSAR